MLLLQNITILLLLFIFYILSKLCIVDMLKYIFSSDKYNNKSTVISNVLLMHIKEVLLKINCTVFKTFASQHLV